MQLHDLYEKALLTIWGEHGPQQEQWLEIVAQIRELKMETLKELGAFFVPNNDYMKLAFGHEITETQYGCYYDDQCVWNRQIVFPIKDVNGITVAFYGFNPFGYLESKETGTKETAYYSSSSSVVFKKSCFMFMPPGCYDKALDDGYLFVVDGFFDCASIWEAGFNAAALLGSTISDGIIMQLRFVKRVIVIADNDDAGMKVFEQLRKRLHNVELYKQGLTKDIDELLHSDYREDTVKSLAEVTRECKAFHYPTFRTKTLE